jgi:hypothetical protein
LRTPLAHRLCRHGPEAARERDQPPGGSDIARVQCPTPMVLLRTASGQASRRKSCLGDSHRGRRGQTQCPREWREGYRSDWAAGTPRTGHAVAGKTARMTPVMPIGSIFSYADASPRRRHPENQHAAPIDPQRPATKGAFAPGQTHSSYPALSEACGLRAGGHENVIFARGKSTRAWPRIGVGFRACPQCRPACRYRALRRGYR